MANFISILSSFVADAVWCCAVVAALSLGCVVVWKWQDLAEGLKGEPKTFRAVFVAMLVVAATLFSKVDPNGAPPNLNAPLSGPVPTLQVGSPDDFADDVAKFAAINWTTNGVDLVLHRPESRATEAVEVTLVGSTNLVTATWEPFTNVVFAVGETNIALRVDRAALDDHSVSNICFFVFINSGDADEDGLPNWHERFNLKTDPYEVDTDEDGLTDGEELVFGVNPSAADSDGDGLNDWDEFVVGSDPLEVDTDGDGISDADEVVFCTDPALADTDGDGLDDWEEIDCVREVGTNDWHLVSQSTTVFVRPAAGTVVDDEIQTVVLPNVVTLDGVEYDRASIDVNGKFHLIPTGGESVAVSDPDNLAPDDLGPGAGDLVVAPFWDDLEMRPTLSSEIKIGVEAATGWLIVQYLNLHVAAGDEADKVVSFQVAIAPGDEFPVRVTYRLGLAHGQLGAGATVGVFDRGRSGGSLGTDPVKEDTDGDGISDGTEIANGMDPCQPDTDGDGMDDGWEFHHGFDPRINNAETFRTDDDATADPDGDGLTNAEECAFGTNPSGVDANGDGVPDGRDTDGDGVADGAEIAQNSDPTNAADDGRPGRCVPIKLYFGDQSSSHSEKYRVELKPVQGPPDVPLPDEVARAEWPSPGTNATTNSAPVHVQTATENYWYCDILFHEFETEEGRVVVLCESLGARSTDLVEWTGQYKQKILKEERFHLKQLRGEVPGSMGGQGDCFTVKGIKYFIARQARNNRDIDIATWRVRGNSAQAAEENTLRVIGKAINNEIDESNKIMLLDRGFVELTAKAHVGYNAAFRYHCTYQNVYGENPVNHVHPAYQNGQNEEEEQ